MSARPYTQTARAAAQDRTRAALLDAAERAFFAPAGWDGASLEAIAAEVGSTKQTLLRHFGSKDGLLIAAADRAFARVRDQRMAAPQGDVAGAVDNLLEHYDEHGARAIRLAAPDGDGPIAAYGQRGREFHYNWVEHAFAPWLRTRRGRARTRLRAALIVACDVHAWWILTHDLGLGRDDVRATLILTIERLLEEDA